MPSIMHTRRGFLKTTSAAALAGAVRPAWAQVQRPNILFVFTDDQAAWTLGASGNAQAHTPHMDQLVRDGAHLVNSFTTTPVCSPSRAALVSSRYGSELGITDWINAGSKEYPGEATLGIDPAITTFPEVLQAAGYRTALIGKWHLGDLPQYHPTKNGYGHFMGFLGGGTTPDNPPLEINGEVRKFEGLTTDILTDHAIKFLKENTKRPFLLEVHYRAPHAKWLPVADEDWAPFANLDPAIPNPDYPDLDVERVKKMMCEYLASIAGVDRNLGRLLDALDVLGLRENTVVVYSADHGYNMGHNGIWHKGNGHWVLKHPVPAQNNIPVNQRPNMYDTSLRVPTMVRWPAVVKPGTVIERTVTNLDWYPTFAELAGAELPKDEPIRGRSIVPLLRGKPPAAWEDDFYAEYSTKHQSKTHMRMYRTPQWKLIRDFLNPERDEFYNLEKDPAETTNEIGNPEYAGIIQRLHKQIVAHMREDGDKVLGSVSKE